jgi:putative ABC transport system permease protein
MLWLLLRTSRRALGRLVVAAMGVAFPVATLAATLIFVDRAVHGMTPAALESIQVDMRAVATANDIDMSAVAARLARVPGVARVERFATAEVVVSAPGAAAVPARLFAVEPGYFANHRWVRVTGGGLDRGALLTDALRLAPGFAAPAALTIRPATAPAPGTGPGNAPGTDEEPAAPGPAAPAGVSVPVGGGVDLHQARTWYEIPLGEMQGDLALVPRAVVVDYATFDRLVLPMLRAVGGEAARVFDPSNTELPPLSLEAHVTVDRAAYPSDPAQAAVHSTRLRRILERQLPGSVLVADNAVENLTMATEDATNAKILFLLLGIPGALVAAGVGLAAASALAEAQRREDALLRLRGATGRQLARLAGAHATIAGVTGSVLGLALAAAAVSAVIGRPVWRDVPAGRLAVSAAFAVAAGLVMTLVRLVPLVRASRRPDEVVQRRLLEGGWTPRWRGARLDLVAIGVGALILGINVAVGGLRPSPIESQTLGLAFYVLLAPIALWLGVTLLVIRLLLGGLGRRTRPERSRPLGTWAGATLRWLGRRPARTGVALLLGALAVAFGTNVVTFTATYQKAKLADLRAAFGADLRLVPTGEAPPGTPPPALPGIAATSPVRAIQARVGTDRKSVHVIDPASYQRTASVAPLILDGGGVGALAAKPMGILVAKEIADGFSVAPGDSLTVTIFPDEKGRTRNLTLEVVGVYRSFPPTEPFAELVLTTAALPAPLPPPDFYLARSAGGPSTDLAGRARAAGFAVTTMDDQVIRDRRSLTALDLHGLSTLESLAAALVAAVGVAVLGAFLVLERRRESAILRAIGATTPQLLTGPALEGALAVVGSLLIGVPLGIGLAVLTIRVLGLFFTLPPPLVVVPVATLAWFGLVMAAASAVALGAAMRTVARQAAASMLREP